ncbi:hypothetical protein BDN71DRAFT_1428742 [Pleurotus eryngii]|uniref:Uncharacterized protein n=1 Tax=Pleurotus eryngii TaxID=5323 RepID=A0A9P6A1I8_PLEER|nr:hypothetical protein BDN71DRAFT_1428742 [Pleurotus eryngii]
MVKRVTYGMGSVHAICWLAASGSSLHEMDWDTYKDEMHAMFLPVNWEYTMWMSILHMKQGSQPFINFILDVMGKNNLLAGMTSFISDNFICNAIEAGIEPDLATECHWENVNCFEVFKAWMDEVKRLDKKQCQHFEEIAKEFVCLNIKVPANNNSGGQAPFRTFTATKPSNAASSSSSSSSGSTFIPIPKLTADECKLLQNNGGCFKCCRFWMNHIGPHCQPTY